MKTQIKETWKHVFAWFPSISADLLLLIVALTAIGVAARDWGVVLATVMFFGAWGVLRRALINWKGELRERSRKKGKA